MRDYPKSRDIRAAGNYKGYHYIVAEEHHPLVKNWWSGYIAQEGTENFRRLCIGSDGLESCRTLCIDCIEYDIAVEQWEKKNGIKYNAIEHGPVLNFKKENVWKKLTRWLLKFPWL